MEYKSEKTLSNQWQEKYSFFPFALNELIWLFFAEK